MSRLPFVLAIALVSTAPAGIASAQPEDATVKLSVRGVDFADPRQVKAFYDHIRVAARAACNSDNPTPWGVRDDRECRVRFIDDAINQINAPLLTEMNSRESR
jgi:UrcA family protein